MVDSDRPDGAAIVGEDPRPQSREWRLERWGWFVMALVVLLGLLGFWGSGLLSATAKTSADGRLTVSYERFVRNVGQSSVVLHLLPGNARDGIARLSIDQRCLSAYQVQSVQPQPPVTSAVGDRVMYEFPARPGSGLTVRLDLRPSGGPGVRECSFGAGASAQVRSWQWVHP